MLRHALKIAAVTALFGGMSGSAHASSFCMASYASFGMISCTIETTGTYDITAYGAQGGTSTSATTGGLGAEIGGAFYLTAGTVLDIAVGAQGGAGTGDLAGGGGGGGSFVLLNAGSAPLVVAGGGGGGGVLASGTGGVTTMSAAGYAGGTNGGGGSAAYAAGAGAGLLGDGAGRAGGKALAGGLLGGASVIPSPALQEVQSCTPGAGPAFPGFTTGQAGAGGFGGGGGGNYAGGGGGGYSGGGIGVDDVVTAWSSWSACSPDGTQFRSRGLVASGAGDGGGSYLDATALADGQVLIAATHAGDGLVTIVMQDTETVPEPASLMLLAGAIALLPLRRWAAPRTA